MLCHSCPNNGKGLDICLTCRDTCNTPYNKGRTHVSIDAAPAGVVASAKVASKSKFDLRKHLPDCCASTAEMIIYLFTELDEHQLCLVMAVLRGETLTDYAKRKHVSVPAVSQMLKRIVSRHQKLKFIGEIL